jgi:hypothetical protein
MAYDIAVLRGTAIRWVKVRCSEFTIHKCIRCRHIFVTSVHIENIHGSYFNSVWTFSAVWDFCPMSLKKEETESQ